MIYIGIDPGSKGGIAVLRGRRLLFAKKLKGLTETDIAEILEQYKDVDESFAMLEKVGARPRGQSSSIAMFKLGNSWGFLRGLLAGFGIRREYVLPTKWQRDFGLLRTDKNETDTAKKNRHKEKAQQLYPDLKITHDIADALLIATYCRKMRRES